MICKMVIAYDGSEPAETAYDYGLDLAAKYSAEVIVLAVARLPEPPEDVETQAVIDTATEYYQTQFAKLREKAARLGLAPRFEVRAVIRRSRSSISAEVEGADTIVMGHRGRSSGRLKRWLLGSISKRVLSYAHCSVIVVR